MLLPPSTQAIEQAKKERNRLWYETQLFLDLFTWIIWIKTYIESTLFFFFIRENLTHILASSPTVYILFPPFAVLESATAVLYALYVLSQAKNKNYLEWLNAGINLVKAGVIVYITSQVLTVGLEAFHLGPWLFGVSIGLTWLQHAITAHGRHRAYQHALEKAVNEQLSEEQADRLRKQRNDNLRVVGLMTIMALALSCIMLPAWVMFAVSVVNLGYSIFQYRLHQAQADYLKKYPQLRKSYEKAQKVANLYFYVGIVGGLFAVNLAVGIILNFLSISAYLLIGMSVLGHPILAALAMAGLFAIVTHSIYTSYIKHQAVLQQNRIPQAASLDSSAKDEKQVITELCTELEFKQSLMSMKSNETGSEQAKHRGKLNGIKDILIKLRAIQSHLEAHPYDPLSHALPVAEGEVVRTEQQALFDEAGRQIRPNKLTYGLRSAIADIRKGNVPQYYGFFQSYSEVEGGCEELLQRAEYAAERLEARFV